MTREISEKNSVVNLVISHSDKAKAIIDSCMEIPIYKIKYSQIISYQNEDLIENYCTTKI